MSAVTLTSLLVAVVALAVTVVALLALLGTRRSVEALETTVRELRAPAPQPMQISLRPAPYDAAPVVVPTPEQVHRATMERPLVRAVALSYGLRRALRPESRDRIAALVRREFRRRRKLRAHAGRRAARLANVEEPS